MAITMSDEDDRYRLKLAIHGVLDAILDAREELPTSPYSCSRTQLKIHTQLQEAHAQMMHALSEENIDAAIAPYMQRVQSTDKKPAHDEY